MKYSKSRYTKSCQTCGNWFETNGGNAKFCDNCRHQAQLERKRRNSAKNYARRRPQGTCPSCGEKTLTKTGLCGFCKEEISRGIRAA